MTDNRTTELLCKLLEERGLSCQTDYLHVVWRVGPKLYDAVDNFDGTLTVDNLTPEQTIAATLGSELGSGTLTAEQVREAVMSADRWEKPMGDTGLTNTHLIIRDDGWQAIADKLNARAERTCKFVSSKGSDYPPVCSACGYELGIYDCEWFVDGTYGYGGNYCLNCGAKVIGGDE